MGGSTTTQQTQQSTQQARPWEAAQPALSGILGQLGGINPGLTGGEDAALSGLSANSSLLNQFTPQATALANNLLAGGGANNQAGMINDAYAQYQAQLNPYASGQYLNPYETPGFGDALSTLGSDISNQVNSQFAAAGRDLSGMNVQTLARGLSQGQGQLIADQYNQNVQNQLGAASSLYGAGNTTGGLLSQLNQQSLANQQAGLGVASTAQDMANSPYVQQLAVEAQRRGIPLETLTQQMGLVLPAAQAFGTTTGNSTGTTTQSVPLAQQLIGGAIGGAGLFGGQGAFGANGAFRR